MHFIAWSALKVLIFALSISIPARGSDFRSPRTDALGGAGHAHPLLTDAIFLNPSATSLTQTRGFSVNYLKFRGDSQGSGDDYGKNLNLSLIDSSADTWFQAGLAYTRRDDSNLIHVGASKEWLNRFGVGVGAKFIFPRNLSTANASLQGGSPIKDASLSISAIITDWLRASFIVDNLLNTGSHMGFFREYLLGTQLGIFQVFSLYIDPHWTPGISQAWGYEVGAEFPFFSDVFFRIGKFQNATVPFLAAQAPLKRASGYGIGIGWLAPKLSLDYGFSRVLSPMHAFSHQCGMTLYF